MMQPVALSRKQQALLAERRIRFVYNETDRVLKVDSLRTDDIIPFAVNLFSDIMS